MDVPPACSAVCSAILPAARRAISSSGRGGSFAGPLGRALAAHPDAPSPVASSSSHPLARPRARAGRQYAGSVACSGLDPAARHAGDQGDPRRRVASVLGELPARRACRTGSVPSDQLARATHEAQRVLERQHAGEPGRHVLAHAVAEQAARPDAPLHPELGQRLVDDEERRLREAGCASRRAASQPVPGSADRAEQRAQVEPEVRREQLRAAVDVRAEHRLALVELGDAGPPGAPGLPGSRKATGRAWASGDAGERARRPPAPRRPATASSRSRQTSARRCGKAAPADLEGVGDVGQRAMLRIGPSRCSASRAAVALQRRRACAPRAPAAARAAREGPDGSARGRLLEHHVGVGAADAERAHARPAAAPPSAGPRRAARSLT